MSSPPPSRPHERVGIRFHGGGRREAVPGPTGLAPRRPTAPAARRRDPRQWRVRLGHTPTTGPAARGRGGGSPRLNCLVAVYLTFSRPPTSSAVPGAPSGGDRSDGTAPGESPPVTAPPVPPPPPRPIPPPSRFLFAPRATSRPVARSVFSRRQCRPRRRPLLGRRPAGTADSRASSSPRGATPKAYQRSQAR